jgi:hypothetical protein
MFGFGTGLVRVMNGKSNGRSFYDELMEGKITIHGKGWKRIVYVKEGQIIDNKTLMKGKVKHHIVYGSYEKEGENIIRFRKGSGKGLHGKSRAKEKLFGNDGICHSWYHNGRLMRQRFIYANNHIAYNYNSRGKECIVRDPKGEEIYKMKGLIDCRGLWGGHSVFNREPLYYGDGTPVEPEGDIRAEWFLRSKPFELSFKGRVILSGQYENGQKIGRWIEGGRVFYYERGVPIPKKLFEMPLEKLNVKEILNLPNAQTRMALMSRIPPERIAKVGRLIHSQGEMRLYSIKGYDTRILRVKCPTTGSFYFLNVPSDSNHCERARQWTFHVGDGIQKPIKFALET